MRNSKKKGWAVATALLTVVGLVMTQSAQAFATSPPAPPGQATGDSSVESFVADKGQAFLEAQTRLDDFGTWIRAQPGAESNGYLGQVNDPASLSVKLLWHAHDGLLTKVLAEAKARGITVTVVPRSANAKQVSAAANAVLAHAAKLAKQGVTVNSVTIISEDTDGIVVNASFSGDLALPASAPAAQSVKVKANRKAVADGEAAAVGVPVTLVEGDAPTMYTATRTNDTSPFNAGGLMASSVKSGNVPTTSYCSSGFGVNYAGKAHTTTARHCSPPSGAWKAFGGSASYGSATATDNVDAVIILSAAGGGRVFDGAWNDSTGYYKLVKHVSNINVGDYVCTSGGNTGVHCNIRVSAFTSIKDGVGSNQYFVVAVGNQMSLGMIAAAQGDSGGPVFTVDAGSSTNRGAAGIIQAGGPNAAYCGSVAVAGVVCSTVVYFTPMSYFLNYMHATLITG